MRLSITPLAGVGLLAAVSATRARPGTTVIEIGDESDPTVDATCDVSADPGIRVHSARSD